VVKELEDERRREDEVADLAARELEVKEYIDWILYAYERDYREYLYIRSSLGKRYCVDGRATAYPEAVAVAAAVLKEEAVKGGDRVRRVLDLLDDIEPLCLGEKKRHLWLALNRVHCPFKGYDLYEDLERVEGDALYYGPQPPSPARAPDWCDWAAKAVVRVYPLAPGTRVVVRRRVVRSRGTEEYLRTLEFDGEAWWVSLVALDSSGKPVKELWRCKYYKFSCAALDTFA